VNRWRGQSLSAAEEGRLPTVEDCDNNHLLRSLPDPGKKRTEKATGEVRRCAPKRAATWCTPVATLPLAQGLENDEIQVK